MLQADVQKGAGMQRALGSVKRMCSSGHMVVFDNDGSNVLNTVIGEVNWMKEERWNDIMDLWDRGQGVFAATQATKNN